MRRTLPMGGKAAHGEGAGGGFLLLQGGYGGPPPEKIENLHALRCIFRTKKLFFRSLYTLL